MENEYMYEIAAMGIEQAYARHAIWIYRADGVLVSCLRRGQEGGGLVAQQLNAVLASIPRILDPEVRAIQAKWLTSPSDGINSVHMLFAMHAR